MRNQLKFRFLLRKELILLILMYAIPLRAQQLYFLRATIENSLTFEAPLPVQLLTLVNHNDSVLLVSKDFTKIIHKPSYSQLSNVLYYPTMNAFCIVNDDREFFFLYTNNCDTLIRFLPNCPSGYLQPRNINVINNHWVYCCYDSDAIKKTDAFIYIAVDSTLNNHFRIMPSAFKDIYITGKNAQRVIIKPNDRHLYLPIVADTASRPSHSIEIPTKYMEITKKFSALIINDNDRAMLALKSEKPKSNEKYGRYSVAVLNKISQQWFDIEFKGNGLNIMTYGAWVAGSVVDVMDWDTKYFPNNKESPGLAERISSNIEYQFKDWYINSGNIYVPGILFLLNTHTQNYIEWNTGQGDSEILLIHKEIVYYRVFDEIYKVSIDNGEKLEKPELLVKNTNVVPFIHWAFIANE